MLVRHVLRPRCVTLSHPRRASTAAYATTTTTTTSTSRPTRHPTRHPKTSPVVHDGVHSFFHHFAPSKLPRTEPVTRARKMTTMRQHLQKLAREREEKLKAAPSAENFPKATQTMKDRLGRKKDTVTLPTPVDAIEQPDATKMAKTSKKAANAVSVDASMEKTKTKTKISISKRCSSDASTETTRKRRRSNATGDTAPPPRHSLRADQSKHHDLESFLAYATSRNTDTASTWYRGTNYEYAVQRALACYHFELHRTGQANDLGIDLLGEWSLPQDMAGGHLPRELKVLIQCKLSTGRPCNVRELEGAYVGAPAGWRGAGVMAFLVSAKPATPGVRGALQRSRLPMGFLQITEDGSVQQFIWNNVAQEARLTGMSTTHSYSTTVGTSDKPQGKIALVYQGRPL